MARVLVTGMSGVGKTTILDELRRRGHLTADADYDRWELHEATWDERRMDRMLARRPDRIVSTDRQTPSSASSLPDRIAFTNC